MNIFLLARRRLTHQPLQNAIAILVMAFSITLSILTLLMSTGLHQAIITAVEPFPLVIGTKGSPNQLLLNTVFLKDVPLGNIPYAVVEQLRRDQNVAQAIPLGFGDNYQGHRLVGTEPGLFQHKIRPDAAASWLHLAQGRLFAADKEVVLGATAAKATGLKIGDSFTTIHGVTSHASAKKHTESFKVTGILAPVNGPYDDAIFTSLSSIWHMHQQHKTKSVVPAAAKGEVTALLVRPSGYAQALKLSAAYAKSNQVQVLFPAKQVIELFNIAGSGTRLLTMLCGSVIILSLIISTCSLYWLMYETNREQAILRSMGASIRLLMRLNFWTGMLIVLSGILIGLAGAHGLYALLSSQINTQTSLVLVTSLSQAEILLILAILACSSLCCLIPAWLNRKQDLVIWLR